MDKGCHVAAIFPSRAGKNVETAGERFFSLVSDNSGDLADIKEELVFRRGIGGENLDIMKRDDKSGPQVTGLCLRALAGEGVVSVHQQSSFILLRFTCFWSLFGRLQTKQDFASFRC